MPAPWSYGSGRVSEAALPDCRLVAAQLAGAFPELEIESSDLAEVAQTIAIRRTATVLRMKLSELINKYSEPIDVHQFLASFPGWRRQLKLDPPLSADHQHELRPGIGARV